MVARLEPPTRGFSARGSIPRRRSEDEPCVTLREALAPWPALPPAGWSDSVGPPLCAPVTLPPLPGTYKVSVITTETAWKGDKCYESIGKVYFSKETSLQTSDRAFAVQANKCAPGTERMIDSEHFDPVEQEGFAGEMQQAFVEALRRRGIDAGPEHVTIHGVTTNPAFFKFVLRVSPDGCLLPHVRVETALIDSGGKGDANGTNGDAVGDALGKALDAMGYESTCTEGVAR